MSNHVQNEAFFDQSNEAPVTKKQYRQRKSLQEQLERVEQNMERLARKKKQLNEVLRKERTGQLIVWGILEEKRYMQADEAKRAEMRDYAKRTLTTKECERALKGYERLEKLSNEISESGSILNNNINCQISHDTDDSHDHISTSRANSDIISNHVDLIDNNEPTKYDQSVEPKKPDQPEEPKKPDQPEEPQKSDKLVVSKNSDQLVEWHEPPRRPCSYILMKREKEKLASCSQNKS